MHLKNFESCNCTLTNNYDYLLPTDSNWGRFFSYAELGKMIDQDLSRLYPEHSGYFHTPICQALLRRVLLLWCLQHPEYGYRQGKIM